MHDLPRHDALRLARRAEDTRDELALVEQLREALPIDELRLEVETPGHVSVYQVVRADRLVFERAALLALQDALAAGAVSRRAAGGAR